MSRPETIAWTGHRPELFADPVGAEGAVETLAKDLASTGGRLRFVVGGQRGVDTWAAQAAERLNLPFTLILPVDPASFVDETWTAAERDALAQLQRAASKVTIVGGPRDAAFSRRNRLLVAGADLLVAVWTLTRGGGTAETIAFARAADTPVRELVLPPSAAVADVQGRGI